MLMEESKQNTISENMSDNKTIYIGNGSVMQIAVDVLSDLTKFKSIILKARGSLIPNAVAVANILTESMLPDQSKVEKVIVDSEEDPDVRARLVSTIEINLVIREYTEPGPFRSIFSHSLQTFSSMFDSSL